MQTFIILRRGAWEEASDWEDAAAESERIADDEMGGEVKWIRSYVIEEEDGTLGSICVFLAEDADTLMEHAQRAGLPADEILPVSDTFMVRDDP